MKIKDNYDFFDDYEDQQEEYYESLEESERRYEYEMNLADELRAERYENEV